MIRRVRREEYSIPLAALLITLVAFFVSPTLSGSTLTTSSMGNVFQQLTWLAPLTLALGVTLMCGEFDISVAGVAPLAGVLAIRAGGHSPYAGAAAALAAGAAIGLVQGLLVSRLRISSVPVTMATYIALTGATLSISGNQIVSYDNSDVALWITKPVLQVLSPGTVIALAVALVVGGLMALTTWGRDSRAVGSDRRASRSAGVRVDGVLVLAFTTSGLLAATSGVLLAFATASANPNPDIQPLVLGIVAALAGGATLKGGRGRVSGLLVGTLAVCLLEAVFSVNAVADWLSQLMFAALLLAVAAFDAPDLARAISRVRPQPAPLEGASS